MSDKPTCPLLTDGLKCNRSKGHAGPCVVSDKPTVGLTDERVARLWRDAKHRADSNPDEHRFAYQILASDIEAIVRKHYQMLTEEGWERCERHQEAARKDERERAAFIVEKRIDCRDFDGLVDAILRGNEPDDRDAVDRSDA